MIKSIILKNLLNKNSISEFMVAQKQLVANRIALAVAGGIENGLVKRVDATPLLDRIRERYGRDLPSHDFSSLTLTKIATALAASPEGTMSGKDAVAKALALKAALEVLERSDKVSIITEATLALARVVVATEKPVAEILGEAGLRRDELLSPDLDVASVPIEIINILYGDILIARKLCDFTWPNDEMITHLAIAMMIENLGLVRFSDSSLTSLHFAAEHYAKSGHPEAPRVDPPHYYLGWYRTYRSVDMLDPTTYERILRCSLKLGHMDGVEQIAEYLLEIEHE